MYFCDHGTTYRIKVMLEYSVNEHSVGAHHRLESYPTVRSIVMTPFRGSYNNVHADIKIRAFPKVVLQDVCPAAQPEQISVTTGNLPGEQGFSVPIAVAVPYSSVTKLLNDYFQKNPKVSIGGDDVVIKDAYAADAGGHVLIALTLDGSIRGSVYLWGDPFADGTSLAIRNLHVETTTDDLLSAIKVGLAQLFLGDLGPRIEAVARIDLAPKIEKLKKKWSEKHELKAGSLTMAVERVDVSRAFSNPDYLAGWVVLEGTQAKLVLKTTP